MNSYILTKSERAFIGAYVRYKKRRSKSLIVSKIRNVTKRFFPTYSASSTRIIGKRFSNIWSSTRE